MQEKLKLIVNTISLITLLIVCNILHFCNGDVRPMATFHDEIAVEEAIPGFILCHSRRSDISSLTYRNRINYGSRYFIWEDRRKENEMRE